MQILINGHYFLTKKTRKLPKSIFTSDFFSIIIDNYVFFHINVLHEGERIFMYSSI